VNVGLVERMDAASQTCQKVFGLITALAVQRKLNGERRTVFAMETRTISLQTATMQ